MHTFYKLVDPRTGNPRYVGRTTQTLDERLRGHIYDSRRSKTRVALWVKELLEAGLRPEIVFLEQAQDFGLHESRWIDRFKKQGFDMLNKYVDCDYSYYRPHPSSKLYDKEQEDAMAAAYPDAHVYVGHPVTPRREACV